jgi:DNA repair exonuclease SbcCD ATPase subunit
MAQNIYKPKKKASKKIEDVPMLPSYHFPVKLEADEEMEYFPEAGAKGNLITSLTHGHAEVQNAGRISGAGIHNARMEQTQGRLEEMRREAEKLEEEKRRLEELQRMERLFLTGRAEISDQILRSLTDGETEVVQLKKRIQALEIGRDDLARALEQVRGIAVENWDAESTEEELKKALEVIEEAKMEFDRHCTRVNATGPGIAAVAEPRFLGSMLPAGVNGATFKLGMFYGLAFCTPVFAVGLLAWLGWLIFA